MHLLTIIIVTVTVQEHISLSMKLSWLLINLQVESVHENNNALVNNFVLKNLHLITHLKVSVT